MEKDIDALELLKKLPEQIPGVVYQFQFFPDGRSCFPYASQVIHDIYEVTPDEVKEDASKVFERIHPEDLERITESIKISAETMGVSKEDYRVILPSKGVRWLQGLAKPERLSEGSILWHGFIQDITQKKENQLEADRLKEQFELAIQGSNDGIWDWDLRTNTAFFSRRWKEQIGYQEHELQNSFDGFKDLVHPDD